MQHLQIAMKNEPKYASQARIASVAERYRSKNRADLDATLQA